MIEQVLVPIGVAVAAGAVASAVTPPHWRAPGLPFFLGDAKNVESVAVSAGLAAALTATWLGARRPPVLAVAAAGFAVLAARAHLHALAAAWLPFLGAIAAPLALDARARGGRRAAPTDDRPRPLVTALALVALALGAFVVGSEPLAIDVFHHGEVLASAVDLLHGGVPFKTFVWPHGAHDTGLAALWIVLTGKIGTSPVALARATCRALGVAAAYALARRLAARRGTALVVAAGLAALPLLGDLPGPAACPDALYQLGILAFVILAFATLTAPTRGRAFVAGALLVCGYLFRIETALYGAIAIVLALATAARRPAPTTGRETAPAFARACGALAAGGALALVVSRLVLGWPDAAWLDYTLRELPRYHRDAVGVPFPWPLRAAALPAHLPFRGTALAWLVFVLLLAVQTVRRVRARDPHADALVFLATFAVLATRSSLDRSDAAHFLQWAALPMIGTALLAVDGLAYDGGRWRRATGAAVLLLLLVGIDGPIVRSTPPRIAPWKVAATLASRSEAAVEHLRTNPPAGPCRDTTMTAQESVRPKNARFLADVCAVDAVLRAHGTRALVVAHSAPWYHVRFGMPPPSKFFAFARAYAPAAQLALVDDLRRAAPDALLRARGYGALAVFDLPDEVRVPVVAAYLRARRGDVRPQSTPLGDLYFWNEPGPDASAPPSSAPGAGRDAEVRVVTDEIVDYPDAGTRLVIGWAADLAHRRPLAGLEIATAPAARPAAASVDYGLPRPDVAAAFDTPALTATGWIASIRADAAPPLPGIAIGVDGVRTRVTLPPSRTRALPRLDGAEWSDLAAAVARARALGEADRRVARERSAGERPLGGTHDHSR